MKYHKNKIVWLNIIKIIILLLSIFINPFIELYAQNNSAESINFYKYSKFITSVALSEKVLVGSVDNLDIRKNGDLLVTDQKSNNVFLFDGKGSIKKTLNIETCKPGIKWHPLKAKYSEKGNIFVIQSELPSGYWFNYNGDCITVFREKIFQPFDFYIDINENIYSYMFFQDFFLGKYAATGNLVMKFGKIPEEHRNYIERFNIGSIIVDGNGMIYQMNICSPEIYKYSQDGVLIKTIKRIPAYYKFIKSDLPSFTNPQEFLEKSNKLLKNISMSESIHILGKNKLLTTHLIGNELWGIEIIDFEGNSIIEEEIFINRKVLFAKDNCVYLSFQPKPKSNGDLPNPRIEKYELFK